MRWNLTNQIPVKNDFDYNVKQKILRKISITFRSNFILKICEKTLLQNNFNSATINIILRIQLLFRIRYTQFLTFFPYENTV